MNLSSPMSFLHDSYMGFFFSPASCFFPSWLPVDRFSFSAAFSSLYGCPDQNINSNPVFLMANLWIVLTRATMSTQNLRSSVIHANTPPPHFDKQLWFVEIMPLAKTAWSLKTDQVANRLREEEAFFVFCWEDCFACTLVQRLKCCKCQKAVETKQLRS